MLSTNPMGAMKNMNQDQRSDLDILRLAFQKDKNTLKLATKEGAIKMITEDHTRFEYLSEEHKCDYDLVNIAYNKNNSILASICKNIVIKIIKEDPDAIK